MYDMEFDWERSIVHWTTLLEHDPNDEFAVTRRAMAYDRAGRLAESGDDWNRLVQITDVSNGDYLVRRAEWSARMGRREAARADLAKALLPLAISPSSAFSPHSQFPRL
jgi:tetratricopeptide (TPR) repeat protein